MKTYNDIYLSTRNLLRQNGVEAYSLEARVLVASAAGKTVQQLLRDINLYTTAEVENRVLDYAARRLKGEPVPDFTNKTAIGALACYISDETIVNFQPMNVNFGILAPLEQRVKGKANKNLAIANRALAQLQSMTEGSAEEI